MPTIPIRPARDYDRDRDLPRLIPIFAHEHADHSPAGRRRLIARLLRGLRDERRRARAGHWGYDPCRHRALAWAYGQELRLLAALDRPMTKIHPASAEARANSAGSPSRTTG